MRILFFNSSKFGLPALHRLIALPNIEVAAVITSESKPKGRHLRCTPTAVAETATLYRIPVFEHRKGSEAELLDFLRPFHAEASVVISFGFLLGKPVLETPGLGSFNLHASLLPLYRGASPMQQAILDGQPQTGVSFMRMVEKLDAGPVLLSKSLELSRSDTVLTLEEKLSKLSADVLEEALPALKGGNLQWVPQDESRATYCAKISKSDGKLDWSKSASRLEREVRAYLGWPDSHAFLGAKRLLVKEAVSFDESVAGHPHGAVLPSPNGTLRVACGQGHLQITKLQLEGRNTMTTSDFLRGYPIKPGSILD